MNRSIQLCLIAVLAGGSAARGDLVVRFDTPDVTVAVGTTFQLNIVADIPLTEPIIGWGLDAVFSNVGVASIVGPPAIGSDWIASPSSDGDGLAGLAPFSFPPVSVSGTGVLLATLTLSADQRGQTDLVLGASAGDLAEGFALDFPGSFATVDYQSAQITVIPAPGAALLTLVGLPMAGWVARRRRSTRPDDGAGG